MKKKLSRIEFWAIDPFDGRSLHGANLPYDKRKSAAGFYTRFHARMKAIAKQVCGDILQGREPKVTIKYHYL